MLASTVKSPDQDDSESQTNTNFFSIGLGRSGSLISSFVSLRVTSHKLCEVGQVDTVKKQVVWVFGQFIELGLV